MVGVRHGMSDRPLTHTQYRDEAPCRADHHYVWDERGWSVCTRCGDSESDTPEEAVPWDTPSRPKFEE